jgi:two-component system, OmpR family, alkaline phosphatase synthesis response regulator PhoP
MAKKILIVDDDPNVHIILKLTFEKAGYEVASAMDAMQGPMKARTEKPDLIILDIMMPAGGGVSVFRRLKQNTITMHIPVIVHSSTLPEAIRDSMPEIDDIPMIQKPADLTVLLDRIAEFLPRA